MFWKRTAVSWFVILTCFTLAGATNIDRKVLRLRTVELPSVAVSDLDFAALRVEVAHGPIATGEAQLRTTKSICVPDKSKNVFKDAVEITTHYYEVPYHVERGVMVVRDESGDVVHSASIDALDSSERFGYDKCAYWQAGPLEVDFEKGFRKLEARILDNVREYATLSATRALDDALFFNIVEEKVPLYTFRDKTWDYSGLNEASDLARAGYAEMERSIAGVGDEGREELQRAVAIWTKALEQSDLNDKTARINRKVTVKLHVSVGVALMALGDPKGAVQHLEKANRYSSMMTSSSSGTGTTDLIQRAQMRRTRDSRNADLPESESEIAALMNETERFRGRIPVVVLPPAELARLRGEHVATATTTLVEAVEQERDEIDAAIASGEENRYERLVGRTATQGFYLFLMPYPEKMDRFPAEVCQLTHLNRLRVPNHTFDEVPEDIGKLQALEVLDLSGNRLRAVPPSIGDLENLRKLNLSGNAIETLPESVTGLKNLKTLELKGNPLADGEIQRLKRLLPGCKIKV